MTVRLADAWFSVDVASAASLGSAADLLADWPGEGREVSLGRWGRSPIVLIRDDEFADRAFILIGPPTGPVVRFTFAGPAFHGLAAALRNVAGKVNAAG